MNKRLPHWALLVLASMLSLSVSAEERILAFDSDITISADATMIVAETIRVRAEGNQIRRGIYRDFPTDYVDAYGNRFVVDFNVLQVSRDGAPERWRTTGLANGVRVYVGNPDRLLDPGEYSYVIRYRTNRQIGYFDDHDELYWNVTGNGWGFVIDQSSATVHLPGSVSRDDIAIEGYTGYVGDQGQRYTVAVADGEASIRTSGSLLAGEGLTLVASWPKGVVVEPDLVERAGYLLSDNRGLLLGSVTFLLVTGYLYAVWSRYGKDPEPGVIFAHYEPPEGYSPASARFISNMGYDPKSLSSAVINLAVKGYVTIINDDDDYSLIKEASKEKLARGEAALLSALFSEGTVLELDDENHAIIGKARTVHRKSLKRDYQNIYFLKNAGLLLPSLAVALLMLALMFAVDAFTPVAIGLFGVIFLEHILFAWLLQAPTPKGRLLMDKLEGFKMYLEVAEKDDLNLRHPPEKTPELFERYLPYAVALGVEQAWADQFTRVFATLNAEQGVNYKPHWYSGDFNHTRLGGFTDSVGSGFASAISSAATPPGSSSGGGGGGSSGGGGGGGGGGGW